MYNVYVKETTEPGPLTDHAEANEEGNYKGNQSQMHTQTPYTISYLNGSQNNKVLRVNFRDLITSFKCEYLTLLNAKENKYDCRRKCVVFYGENWNHIYR